LGVRLVHGESDGLPGFILDQYGDTLVLQVLSAGAEHWRDIFSDLALELTGAARVFERSDADVRQLENLPSRIAILQGDEPPERIAISENGLNFLVDVRHGHKTGFYLDQRANRLRVRDLSQGREALDCFCYTGGITANILAGGAKSVLAIDSSTEALALNRENLNINHLPLERVDFIEGDVFQELRKFRDSRQMFDLIILDPPKFAPTAAQAERAARGYKDINLLAFKLLRPGGILVTFSCSGGVSAELFQSIVAGAALDAGANAQILEYLHQDFDHPVALPFPEGAYLKGFVIRVA
jgi:23S rRNA (cytosine1962-C5)-methyltransferase